MTYRKRYAPGEELPPPHRRKLGSLCVVCITDDEAASVGVKPGDMNWGDKIKPLLTAKGFPAHELYLGNTKVRTFRIPGNITQFELLG